MASEGSTNGLHRRLEELEEENRHLRTLLQAGGHAEHVEPKDATSLEYGLDELFDLEEIQAIQDAFALATGTASMITKPDGTPLTRPSNFCRLCSEVIRGTTLGEKNCQFSDSSIGRYHPEGPIVSPCHSGGLWDGGASISVGGVHLANWLVGQVRNEHLDEDQMLGYARVIGADEEQFRQALSEVTYMPKQQFEQVARFLFLMANQLSKLAHQNLINKRYIAELDTEACTREKLEKQLRHAQKLEAIGRLAGGIAHDFNNILNVINGYAELMLLGQGVNDDVRKKLQIMHGAGQRAIRLTQQLVTLSRKQIISPRLVHLERELAELHKVLTRLIGNDVEVSIYEESSLWPVKMDPAQLELVVVNLSVNARDAMPQGGKLVFTLRNISLDDPHLMEGYEMEPGDYVMFSVSDTGKGMSPEVQEQIFEPFFTTKGMERGTGLGLAIVYGIVKQNKGYINVSSEEGQGTTFEIYLPRGNEQRGSCGLPLPGTDPMIVGTGHESILLVEDEKNVRELCAAILKELGYRVFPAKDGVDALEVAGKVSSPMDLLLTDVVMPKMNGPELADRLRGIFPELRVLYMSGYAENAIMHHGALDNKINFLNKPITAESLAVSVRGALDTPP